MVARTEERAASEVVATLVVDVMVVVTMAVAEEMVTVAVAKEVGAMAVMVTAAAAKVAGSVEVVRVVVAGKGVDAMVAGEEAAPEAQTEVEEDLGAADRVVAVA